MHSPRIPQNQISGFHAHLQSLTSLLRKELGLLLIKHIEILQTPRANLIYRGFVGMRAEELLDIIVRAAEDSEPTVFRPVGVEVQYALDTLHAVTLRGLVHVWPFAGIGVLEGRGYVDAVKGDEELRGLPKGSEGLEYTWFPLMC